MSRYYLTSTALLVIVFAALSLDGLIHVPRAVYYAAAVLYLVLAAWGSAVLRASYYTPVVSRGSGDAVALTFDDGPINGKTDLILDILAARGMKAAFFCIGSRVAAEPELAKRIFDDGHLLGNHSYHHSKGFPLKSASMVARELAMTDNVVRAVAGKRPRFFRPPFGVTNPMIAAAVRRSNHRVVGWSVRSLDSVIRDPRRLLARVTGSLHPGAIILFHDYSDAMIQMLPQFLDHLSERGVKVVRLDDLIGEKAYG